MSSIDLMKVPATSDKANLYVTTLIQMVYTIEELVSLQPDETHQDERYQLIRGNTSVFLYVTILIICLLEAVRCRFRLTNDQLDQLFNNWLREVFLAKRRVAVKKLKSLQSND